MASWSNRSHCFLLHANGNHTNVGKSKPRFAQGSNSFINLNSLQLKILTFSIPMYKADAPGYGSTALAIVSVRPAGRRRRFLRSAHWG